MFHPCQQSGRVYYKWRHMKSISLAHPLSHPLAHCASKAISLQVQYRCCGVEHSLPWKCFFLCLHLISLRSQESKHVLFVLVLFRLQVAPIPEGGRINAISKKRNTQETFRRRFTFSAHIRLVLSRAPAALSEWQALKARSTTDCNRRRTHLDPQTSTNDQL